MDRILVVDGSVQNTDLISQILRSQGYETITAESGHNALAKAELFKPDLILLDVDLPDISGYDVCKKIKTNPESRFILVLCVSVISTNETLTHAIEVGCDDFIEKSFDQTFLISKVNSLLRIKHLSEQLKQKYNELEEKNNILNLQLKMGRQVQRSLISEMDFSFNSVHFISKYMPALEIGGDFYDVVKINDDCIGVVMGDVSGHGISAALLTSMLNMMIKNLVVRYFNPDQLLFNMNNEFYNIFENSEHEMYSCVFYAIIDTQKKKIYYSNAGQSLPIYINAAKNTATELVSSGVPIGLIPNSLYEYNVMDYNVGDMFFFHTDGLCDTFYKEHPDEFSERLKNSLLDVKSLPDKKEVIDIVLGEFYNFNASETAKYELDDVSIILCSM